MSIKRLAILFALLVFMLGGEAMALELKSSAFEDGGYEQGPRADGSWSLWVSAHG